MKIEPVHTLILGAGTSGLAAGHALVKAGIKPVILEKDPVPGGLFRSIHHGDFIVDIGERSCTTGLPRWTLFGASSWETTIGNTRIGVGFFTRETSSICLLDSVDFGAECRGACYWDAGST